MKRYSLNNPEEEQQITKILENLGIIFGYDLFGNIYFLVEPEVMAHVFHRKKQTSHSRKRSPNMDDLTRTRIKALREAGKSIREIVNITGYSIGAVHSATNA